MRFVLSNRAARDLAVGGSTRVSGMRGERHGGPTGHGTTTLPRARTAAPQPISLCEPGRLLLLPPRAPPPPDLVERPGGGRGEMSLGWRPRQGLGPAAIEFDDDREEEREASMAWTVPVVRLRPHRHLPRPTQICGHGVLRAPPDPRGGRGCRRREHVKEVRGSWAGPPARLPFFLATTADGSEQLRASLGPGRIHLFFYFFLESLPVTFSSVKLVFFFSLLLFISVVEPRKLIQIPCSFVCTWLLI